MTAEAVVDLDPIIPETGMVTVDGIRCRVRRMKTREVFASGTGWGWRCWTPTWTWTTRRRCGPR
jgi:hypothetical protein